MVPLSLHTCQICDCQTKEPMGIILIGAMQLELTIYLIILPLYTVFLSYKDILQYQMQWRSGDWVHKDVLGEHSYVLMNPQKCLPVSFLVPFFCLHAKSWCDEIVQVFMDLSGGFEVTLAKLGMIQHTRCEFKRPSLPRGQYHSYGLVFSLTLAMWPTVVHDSTNLLRDSNICVAI